MRVLIVLLLLASPSLASEPVTVTIESNQGQSGPFLRLIVKAQNNTNRSFRQIFYRCTAFHRGVAVGHQTGIISNLRPNAVAYGKISVEAPRSDAGACEFERLSSLD